MIPAFIDKSKIPHRPGVYIYHDDHGKILYVGKAIDLYHRVASYFNSKHEDLKTIALVEHIRSLETIEVASELEALILEANLIKKYLPPYNIRLTDDKDYLYIKITKEVFPRILTARKKELGDAKEYFGPFPSSRIVRNTLKKLRRIFPWCAVAQSGRQWDKPCFYYHLGLCPGACAGKISPHEYNKIISRFAKFMQGKKEELVKSINEEMNQHVQKLEFEQAQASKKIIEGLEYLSQSNSAEVYLENPNFLEDQNKQAVEKLKADLKLSKLPERIECYDISNIGGKFAVGSLVVLTSGDIDKKWYRKFKIIVQGKSNDVGMMAEVIRRRINHPEWPKPDLILVDGGKGQVRAAFVEMCQKGWSVPVFGLAKRMEWLYTVGEEVVKLPKSSASLRLLQKIRDEAHRVAVSYHRKLRDNMKFSGIIV